MIFTRNSCPTLEFFRLLCVDRPLKYKKAIDVHITRHSDRSGLHCHVSRGAGASRKGRWALGRVRWARFSRCCFWRSPRIRFSSKGDDLAWRSFCRLVHHRKSIFPSLLRQFTERSAKRASSGTDGAAGRTGATLRSGRAGTATLRRAAGNRTNEPG